MESTADFQEQVHPVAQNRMRHLLAVADRVFMAVAICSLLAPEAPCKITPA